jgi:hypothetical protein
MTIEKTQAVRMHSATLPSVNIEHPMIGRQSPTTWSQQSHKHDSLHICNVYYISRFHSTCFISHGSTLSNVPLIIN